MRADPRWMLDRSVSVELDRLSAAQVLVVGAGSLGSLVAMDLARAGVGHLTLIDPQSLDPANVGRHALGIQHIGQDKAEGLANQISVTMPHMKVTPITKDLEDALEYGLQLDGFDLVVCTTADWPCELRLIVEKQKGMKPPLLLSWVEPFGAAGHGALIVEPGRDAKRLFTNTGQYINRLSRWPEDVTHRRLPACGATFQPAGLLHIQPVATMVSGLVVESLLQKIPSQIRTWWTSKGFVESRAGVVTETSCKLNESAISIEPIS